MASNENEIDAAQVYLLGKTYLANNQGQFYIRNDPIAHMAAGDRHTIIVTESGRAFAFGDNSSGQLGLGHTNNVEKVSCIKSLKFGDTGERVILVACGRESSLVATNRGSLYGFGSNSRSQLGIETSESTLNQLVPTKIEHFRGKISWKQISMGAEHTCALTDEGLVYVWGANDEGQCGQPKKIEMVKAPRELRMAHPVVAISCGYYHTALVTENGKLFVLGSNDDRQLGRTISDKFAGPEEVSFSNKVIAVACGHQHTVVLTDKGEVYVSGLGDRGQLGLGSRVISSEKFELIPGLPKRVTAISAGEAHTAVIGNRHDIYIFGDGKHGKLGSTTHSNEFEPCFIERFKNYNVFKVVCGGCQTIVLAQKKTSETKKSSGSEEDIGNATLSITQRPKSHARSMRNKNLTDRSTIVGDSMDSTLQHARPLGKPNNLRIESDDDKSEKDLLSESLKSATFNQTHTITNGKFLPTQSPSLNRTSFRSNDDDLKPLKTGVLDRTALRLNKDADDLGKTNNRLPSIEKTPVPVRNQRLDRTSPPTSRKIQDLDDNKSSLRNTRFDRTSPSSSRKKREYGDEEEEEKSSSDEQPKSLRKKPEQPTSIPQRNERKRSPVSRSPSPVRIQRKPSPLSRRRNDSDSENDKPKRSSPIKAPMSETLNRKARQQKRSDDDDDDDDDNDDDEDTPRKSSRQSKQPPPTVTRRGSLPPQTRSGTSGLTSSRDGNQTIGSRPVDGVRGSFRAPATKTLAKPNTNNDTTKKETPPTQQPGFFSRLFGAKSTPPPTPAPPPPTTTTTTTASSSANPSSRTCSVM